MGLGGLFGGFYGKIEDAFYGFTDFLEAKGLPVYSVIDPLEEHGVPAFPLSIALLLIIGFLAYAFVFAGLSETKVLLNITSADGKEQLRGVALEAASDDGKKINLGDGLFANGQAISLSGVPLGKRITFSASKVGFQPDSFELKLTGAGDEVILRLPKNITVINGRVKLVDPNGTSVDSAKVTAKFVDNTSVVCSNLGNGVYECAGLTEGEQVQLNISSSNYEDLPEFTQFFEGSVPQFTLSPKAGAATGQSNLIVRVSDEAGKPVGNANIKIFDAKDDGLITDVTETGGEYLARINKGTSLRISVSAQHFVRYDSTNEGIERTMRADEELWAVILKPGGVSVTVRVRDQSSLPLSEADVSLFNSDGKIIDSKPTGLGGEVVFDDLKADDDFFVSGYKAGFLAKRLEFRPTDLKEINLDLVRAGPDNSVRVSVFVLTEDGLAANDATVSFFEKTAPGEIPLGIPPQKSDVTGKLSVLVPLNISLVGRAAKNNLSGEDAIEVKQGGTNELFIKLLKPANFVDFALQNPAGAAITAGHVNFRGTAGDILFDEDLEKIDQNDMFFDPQGNDYVEFNYLSPQNFSFSSQVYVKGQEKVAITIDENRNATEFSPTINFDGVFDISGKKADGVNKGTDYFLQFEANFPQGNGKHGVHVRVGDDTVKYADSQDVGIIGYSAVGATPFFGRTFSPLPTPGLEGIDFSNEGKAGNFNKWIELYFGEPGAKIVKVRVKAKETATDAGFDVHYRAWSQFGPSVNRDPKDSVLSLDFFSSQRGGLYADTKTEAVKIFDSTSTCKKNICASYKFLNKDNSEVKVEDFKPIFDDLYALEITLNPSVDMDGLIKATTSKSGPKLFFQGYAIDNATVFPDNNKTDTSIEVSGILSPAGKQVKALLFFKTVDLGPASITVQAISGDTVVNGNFFFEIFREKLLTVQVTPSDVKFGEDFSFTVKDADGNPVKNAQISISDSQNQHLLTIIGTGTTDKGHDGIYKIHNTFDTGTVHYTVAAPQFKPASGEIQITRDNVLSLPDVVEIKIYPGQGEVAQVIGLENVSGENVDTISFEIKRIGNFPQGLSIHADPILQVEANSSEKLSIKATYSGKLETAHGEAIFLVHGRVGGKFNVSAQTKVIIDFNPAVPPNCIEFSKAGLVVFLESGHDQRSQYDTSFNAAYYSPAVPGFSGVPGAYNNNYYNPNGSGYDYSTVNQNLGLPAGTNAAYDPSVNFSNYNYSGYGYGPETANFANQYSNPLNRYYGYNKSSQEQFLAVNKCDFEVEFSPQVVPRSAGINDGINVQVNSVKLKPAGTVQGGQRLDQALVKVTVSNTLLRNYPSLSRFDFDIFFNSPIISKSIPLNVLMWDPVFGLEISRNIELYLAQENPTTPARAQAPIFIRNVGQAPIESLSFRQTSGGASRGNVNVRVEPIGQSQVLPVGASLLPPKIVVAEAARTEKTTPLDVKILDVTGVINGHVQDFGPIYVTTHVSGFECLSVTPGNLDFVSTKTSGSISKTLNVKNSCSEEIRLTQLNPSEFGSNTLNLISQNQIIPPGTTVQAEVILNKNISMTQQATVVLDGFLVRSARFIQSNPITVGIKIGQEALSTTAAVEQKTLLVCQTGEKKSVKFPKIATTPDCENAYCDAELMAEFLVSKAGDKLKEVQRQVANYKSDIANTSCINQAKLGYCSFENLNTRIETYRVFFQNDSLTPDFFKKIADTKGAGLGKFKVDYIVGKDAGGAIGQIGNKVLLNGIMSGCGLYTIQIGGAVKVIGGRLDPDLTNILIDFFPIAEMDNESQLTEQCLPRAQNLMNFLPQDKSQKNDSGSTWFGLVQARENSLKGIAKEVAKGMFNAEERFVDNAEGSNYIDLAFGAPKDYLVKIEMQQDTGGGPKRISAQIQETGIKTNAATAKTIEQKNSPTIELQPAAYPPQQPNPASQQATAPTPPANPGTPAQNPPTPPAPPSPVAPPTGDQQPIQRTPPTTAQPEANNLKTQVEREATLAITGLKKNAIDGCISENDDYLLLKSAVQLTGFEIEMSACTDQLSGKEGIVSLIPGQQNCCTLKASSPLSEKVVPSFIATDIPGIWDTKFLQNDSDVSGKEVELTDKDAKTNKYASSMMFCTTANEKDFLNANGKKVTLAAKSAKNEERHATDQQVSLEVCGIHPDKLIQKITEIKPAAGKGTDTYYATLVWQGEPQQINLSDITGGEDAKARLAGAKEALASGKPLAGQTEIESQKRNVKLEGLGAYLGACGVASILSSWKFGFGWFSDLIFNCAIPAANAASELSETTKNIKDFIIDTVKGIPVVGNFASFIADQTEKFSKSLSEDPAQIDDAQRDEIAIGALTSVPAYTAARVLGASLNPVNIANNYSVAAQISNQMSKAIIDEQFRKIIITPGPRSLARLSPFEIDAFRVAVRDSYLKEIQNALNKYRGRGYTYSSIPGGAADGKTVLQLAIEEANGAVAKDKTVLDSFIKLKDSFVDTATKDKLKTGIDNAKKEISNIDELKSAAAESAEPITLEFDYDRGELKTRLESVAEEFKSEHLPKYKDYLKKVYGKDFLEQQAQGGTQTIGQLMEKDWVDSVEHSITGLQAQVVPGNISTERTFLVNFNEKKAKQIMEAAVNKAKSNSIIKTELEGFAKQKAAKELFAGIGATADDFITKQNGKFKLNTSKFMSLLSSPLTLNFWKTMAKGAISGYLSNAAGLWVYDKFMSSKYAAIAGAGVKISAETTQGIDSTGNGTIDAKAIQQANDKPLVKYETYPIVLTQKDGTLDWKIKDSIETDLIPKGAKRIQECNSSIYDKYQGLPNLAPRSEPFQQQKLLPQSNISAVVNYSEKGYGRMLKDIGTQKNYGVPEALVVTVAMSYSGLGAEKDKADWIAGCKVGDSKWKAPAANFRCAAEELAKGLKDPSCGSDPKCAMKKYFNNDSKLDYDVLQKSFNVWNSDGFKLAKNVQTG